MIKTAIFLKSGNAQLSQCLPDGGTIKTLEAEVDFWKQQIKYDEVCIVKEGALTSVFPASAIEQVVIQVVENA